MSGENDWLDYAQKLGPAVGALVSSAAVIVALVVAMKSARKSRNEQAEQITAWFASAEMRMTEDGAGKANVDVTINNASNQMVYDLIAQVVQVRTGLSGKPAAKHLNPEFGARLGAIPPGQRTVPLPYPGAGMHKRLGVELAFQDAAGNYWFRAAQGALRRIRKAPADFYDLEKPVTWRE